MLCFYSCLDFNSPLQARCKHAVNGFQLLEKKLPQTSKNKKKTLILYKYRKILKISQLFFKMTFFSLIYQMMDEYYR